MTLLSPPRWVKLAFVATAAVFVLHAAIFFTRTAPGFVHSDAATAVLLTKKILEARAPIVPDYYYVNGDLWILGGQWFAAPFVLALGVSPAALFATNALAVALETAALTWAFGKLGGRGGGAIGPAFAALVTLFSWSTIHMCFTYVEMAYGMIATWHFVVFVLYAGALARADDVTPGWRRDAGLAVVLFFVLAAQNPTRALAFELAPLLAGCLWRWEPADLRARCRRLAAATAGAWLLAFPVHRFVLRPLVTPAVQAGAGFGLRGPGEIVHNVEILARGLLAIAAPRDDLAWSAPLGLVVIGGAGAWVFAHVRRARTYDPSRFVAVALLSEVALVLGIFVVGDMLADAKSMRYLMPGLLPLVGLACLLATREAGTSRTPRTARIALAWLCVLPIDAAVAASRRVSGAREYFVEADPTRLQAVAAELVRRDLRHGFATYWNANTLTLLSDGAAKTCAVAFRDGVIPRKWLVDTACFDATRLPPSIYVVAAPGEHDAAARALADVAFPVPADRFTVDGFEVRVFRTSDCPLEWLALPRPRS